MSEPLDLDAIRARYELTLEPDGDRQKFTKRLYASSRDVPALIAEVEWLRPVLEAARAMVAERNERHGQPDNPDWWSGWDFKLVAAVDAYEASEVSR